jgi:hypothetical protein
VRVVFGLRAGDSGGPVNQEFLDQLAGLGRGCRYDLRMRPHPEAKLYVIPALSKLRPCRQLLTPDGAAVAAGTNALDVLRCVRAEELCLRSVRPYDVGATFASHLADVRVVDLDARDTFHA